MKHSTRTVSLLVALAACGSNYGIGLADSVTVKPGLAPQFSRWPVPIYTSDVSKTFTWASNSYEIETNDSPSKIIAWYVGKLKHRAMRLPHKANSIGPEQVAVDGGSYVINLMASRGKTSINVIKN